MTAYDDWKTTKQEIDDEAWEDAVDQVAADISDSTELCGEVVSIIANADDVVRWLCGAVIPPDPYLHAFRDLANLTERLRNDVEKEMKEYRNARD